MPIAANNPPKSFRCVIRRTTGNQLGTRAVPPDHSYQAGGGSDDQKA
jgi:hypothetical protein